LKKVHSDPHNFDKDKDGIGCELKRDSSPTLKEGLKDDE
jgi:hypothetical protein